MNDKFESCIGLVAILTIAVITATIMNGWAFSILWGWFMVPVFGLPPLSVVQSIGIAMTISFLISKSSDDVTEKSWTDIAGQYIGKAIIYPVLVVAIGWLVSGLL